MIIHLIQCHKLSRYRHQESAHEGNLACGPRWWERRDNSPCKSIIKCPRNYICACQCPHPPPPPPFHLAMLLNEQGTVHLFEKDWEEPCTDAKQLPKHIRSINNLLDTQCWRFCKNTLPTMPLFTCQSCDMQMNWVLTT